MKESKALPREEIIKNLGPLATLAGIWEGAKGDDIAPDDNRTGIENNKFRERMTYEPFGPVNNHEQVLWGLRYSTTAWRLDEVDAFHEETGYWLWDPKAKQVLRCFIVPRGVTVLAGGTVEPNAKSFELKAEAGSDTYGICSNKFLDQEFKTVRYELKIKLNSDDTLEYEEHTYLKMKNSPKLFDHSDKNTFKKIKF